jgi:acetyl esterase/lipase
MARPSFVGVAEFLRERGFAAFNIEYRLCGSEPWPACGDDCLKAADFLLSSGDGTPALRRDRLFVIGASAGGHLALMTGLRLPPEKVSGVVSISGVADLAPDMLNFPSRYKSLFGHEPRASDVDSASPLRHIRKGQPPVLCTHCPLDNVVDISSQGNFVARCRQLGVENVEFFEYERPLEAAISHCIWIPGSEPHKLYPEIEEAIRAFAAKLVPGVG